ncbi:MAG: ParM/StbA family protein [Anaerolineae bacterium]
MMGHYIASSDTGNGNTNVIVRQEGGREKSLCIASIRARVSSQTLGLGKQAELDYVWAEISGVRYAFGDDCLVVNRAEIDRHMGEKRYLHEHHRSLTAYGLARLGVKSGSVDLTLMCPPKLYGDLKDAMIETYRSNPVEIMLRGDKKPRTWAYSNVTVWPEGFPAAACFMLEKDGSAGVARVMAGDVLIVDTGAHTANAFIAHNGKFNSSQLVHSSIEHGGGDTHIRTPLLEWVRGQGGELSAVTTDDIDRVLRLAAASGDYTLKFGLASVDLLPALEQLALHYAHWLANNVIDSRFDGLRGINRVLVVGGNAAYVMSHFAEWYPGKAITEKEWAGLNGWHPADLNAVGGLRLALARLNKGKA